MTMQNANEHVLAAIAALPALLAELPERHRVVDIRVELANDRGGQRVEIAVETERDVASDASGMFCVATERYRWMAMRRDGGLHLETVGFELPLGRDAKPV